MADELHDPIKRSIVSFPASDGHIVGVGFLIAERYVMTCAHVVNAAIGVPEGEQFIPTARLTLRFPFLSNKEVYGTTVGWFPVAEPGTDRTEPLEDIAILSVDGPMPSDSQPVATLITSEIWDREYRVFGYPQGSVIGNWVPIVGREAITNQWVQVEAKRETGHFIQPGFSGSPVWDNQRQASVGMIVARDRNAETRTAYIIPLALLTQALANVLGASHSSSKGEFSSKHKSTSNRDRARLPVFSSQFIGRIHESDSLKHLIMQDNVRMVTLLGPSGVGKTRLAVAVAEELTDQFVGGVHFVRLSHLTRPELVPSTIVESLQLKERRTASIDESLFEYLSSAATLLILDGSNT